MKKFINEFKEFAIKGNVFDMAIGVIIGAAFKDIVNSLVTDVFTPIIGIITGGIDFTSLSFGIGNAQIMIGNFINSCITFILVAFALFLFVKTINRFKRKEEIKKEVAKQSNEELLLIEIRDLLKNKYSK